MNIVDKALIKILKIARALTIVKTFLYLIGGILILVLNEMIYDYIYLIVGIDLILTASLEFIEEIVNRRYKTSNTHIGSAAFTIIAGVLILTLFNEDLYKVSVMWAVATVVNSTMEINVGLHEIGEKKAFSIINFVFAIAEIAFSILLLIEPEENTEHFITHIYLLGIGFILESAEELIRVFSPVLRKVPVVNNLPPIVKMADEEMEEKKRAKREKMKKEKIKNNNKS